MNVPHLAPSTRYYVLGLVLLVAGCASSSNVIGPENELEVNNASNTFQWQVTALSNITQTLEYTWVTTGTIANVNQSSSLGSGSADLRIQDAGGVEVYSRSLANNGTFQTAAGAAGNWTVTVTLSKANGTLNFRLQKP
jgi:hypothetical protein